MKSNHPRSREHARLVERLVALAESHGVADAEALRADVEVVIKIEYLTFQRAVRSAEERFRRRAQRGTKTPTPPAA